MHGVWCQTGLAVQAVTSLLRACPPSTEHICTFGMIVTDGTLTTCQGLFMYMFTPLAGQFTLLLREAGAGRAVPGPSVVGASLLPRCCSPISSAMTPHHTASTSAIQQMSPDHAGPLRDQRQRGPQSSPNGLSPAPLPDCPLSPESFPSPQGCLPDEHTLPTLAGLTASMKLPLSPPGADSLPVKSGACSGG